MSADVRGIIGAVVLAVWPSVHAVAVPVTFTLTGVVTAEPVSDPADPFGGLLASGALISGSYTFDSTGTDLIPADPASGSYAFSGAPYGMSFTIDGVPFGRLSSISINTQNAASDFYGVLAIDGPLTVSMSFTDPSGGALSSDALPLTSSALAGFFGAASRDFNVFFDDTANDGLQYQVQGTIDSVTSQTLPEPGSLALLCAGISSGLFLRRRPRA